MKIQITGASGFVGTNLLKYLAGNLEPVKVNDSHPFIVNADVFIHLAGLAHNKKGSITKEKYHSVNTELTKQLYDSFLCSTATKFIIISSVKAITDDYLGVITEQTPESPTTDYGISKLAADRYILSRELPFGKSVYILRPSLITGPGVKGNLRRLYNFSKSPFSWFLSSINNKKSYCNILNLCFVIQELINRNDIEGGIYLIADDEPLSTSDVVNLLSNKKNSNKFLSFISTVFITIGLGLGYIINSTSFFNMLTILSKNYIISNKKITRSLGKSLPYSSSDGIRSIK
jgi:nucleoside-diphosphate-sugar epimerase